MSKRPFTLLSNDPGPRNWGYGVLQLNRGRVTVVECGMLAHQLRDLKGDIMGAKDAFKEEWFKLCRRHRPNEMTAERYMSQRQGLSNEFVNWMLGAVWITSPVPLTVYNAATWKMKANGWLSATLPAAEPVVTGTGKKKKTKKGPSPLEQFYKQVGTAAKGGAPDHCVDATLNGLYYLERDHSVNVAALFATEALTEKFAQQIRAAYIGVPE